jgi:hypothetical protein
MGRPYAQVDASGAPRPNHPRAGTLTDDAQDSLEQAQKGMGHKQKGDSFAMDSNSKPVDHPSRETVEVRQGTGPRATVSVLFISVTLAVIAGIGFAAGITFVR